MSIVANRSEESEARAYCISLGLDPDEMVSGYDHRRWAAGVRGTLPRWQWYTGVSQAALRRPI